MEGKVGGEWVTDTRTSMHLRVALPVLRCFFFPFHVFSFFGWVKRGVTFRFRDSPLQTGATRVGENASWVYGLG